MRALFTLTTDFGLDDAYVGIMKGVILSLNPDAVIVDLCHSVAPQDISAAAYIISSAYAYFPPGTIHVVVVDPGVGSARRGIIVQMVGAIFVAPDNGVLSYVFDEASLTQEQTLLTPGEAAVYPPPTITVISNRSYWLPSVSQTFHGRDIFAPVAAHLSLGVPAAAFGEPASEVVLLPRFRPVRCPDGSLIGHVIHIDRFGNAITDVRSQDIGALDEQIEIEVKGQRIAGLSPYYAAGRGLLALVGSSDRVEIALADGNAAAALNLKRGDELIVRSRTAR
ncbi:MAG: SAM-dependent chlorinase/fluorinase [Chloroflexi bacterium]|nr:SAM-dependent chlorinase/fluorinase [Chloroflexota bacterium]MCL5075568.1 SAM-dependent chlorinase/fluorinase [Chloroflexota bacterium]